MGQIAGPRAFAGGGPCENSFFRFLGTVFRTYVRKVPLPDLEFRGLAVHHRVSDDDAEVVGFRLRVFAVAEAEEVSPVRSSHDDRVERVGLDHAVGMLLVEALVLLEQEVGESVLPDELVHLFAQPCTLGCHASFLACCQDFLVAASQVERLDDGDVPADQPVGYSLLLVGIRQGFAGLHPGLVDPERVGDVRPFKHGDQPLDRGHGARACRVARKARVGVELCEVGSRKLDFHRADSRSAKNAVANHLCGGAYLAVNGRRGIIHEISFSVMGWNEL